MLLIITSTGDELLEVSVLMTLNDLETAKQTISVFFAISGYDTRDGHGSGPSAGRVESGWVGSRVSV